MNDETLVLLYDYIDEIKQSPTYIEYKELEKTLEEDLKEELASFRLAKEQYSLSKSYGNFYPGIKEIEKEFLTKKHHLEENPRFKRFKELELTLFLELESFKKELMEAING